VTKEPLVSLRPLPHSAACQTDHLSNRGFRRQLQRPIPIPRQQSVLRMPCQRPWRMEHLFTACTRSAQVRRHHAHGRQTRYLPPSSSAATYFGARTVGQEQLQQRRKGRQIWQLPSVFACAAAVHSDIHPFGHKSLPQRRKGRQTWQLPTSSFGDSDVRPANAGLAGENVPG
jgi:hypothetical protein